MKKGTVTLRSHHKADTAVSLADHYERYFTVGPVYFRENFPYAFIDQRRFRLEAETKLIDEVLYVPYRDIVRIYAQSFNFSARNGCECMSHHGTDVLLKAGEKAVVHKDGGEEFTIDEIPVILDGLFFIPVEGIMKSAFGMITDWQRSYLAPGDYLGISEKNDIFPDVMFLRELAINAKKVYGTLRECYYYEKAHSLMPYRLYIPSGYDPSGLSKMIVYLHGAVPKTNPDIDIEFTRGSFERICDRYNYILLAVDGYAEGFYGGRSPEMDADKASEEEKVYLDLCEGEVLAAVRHVCGNYSIDKDHVFLMGNSMGGSGTLWLGNKYPGMWKAIVPCGCLTNQDPRKYELSGLTGMPVLLVCGTENIGYEGMKDVTDTLNSMGIPAELLTVGAGKHEDAWIIGLPEIFAYLEQR